MKKILVLGFMLMSFKLFATVTCFNYDGSYYNVKTSTSTAVTVSSFTVTTSAAVQDGVERIFKITGTPTGNLFFQRGGSTTTIVTNGMPLDPSVYYVEDKYFGSIYFESDAANINLRISSLNKE